VHWLKVHELPQLGRGARGKSLANLLHLEERERISGVLPVRSFDEGGYVVLCTSKGTIKKTVLEQYSNPRRGGIIAINLADDDELIGAARTSGEDEILVSTSSGKAIRFHESQVRTMGRTAAGVRAIATRGEDRAVSMELLRPGKSILTITRNGFGKRSLLDDYREQNRGGQGIITIKTTARNGPVVGILQVQDGDEVMMITSHGKIIRMIVDGIPTMGRNTQGVRLMETGAGEHVVSVTRLAEAEDAAVEGLAEGQPADA
jgi:DNA gyrase subunit A